MGNDGGAIGKNVGGGRSGTTHRAALVTKDLGGAGKAQFRAERLNAGPGLVNVPKQRVQEWIQSGGKAGTRPTGAIRSAMAKQSRSIRNGNLTKAEQARYRVSDRYERVNMKQPSYVLRGTRTMYAKNSRELRAVKSAMTRSLSRGGSINQKSVGSAKITRLSNGTYRVDQRWTAGTGGKQSNGRPITFRGVPVSRSGKPGSGRLPTEGGGRASRPGGRRIRGTTKNGKPVYLMGLNASLNQ